MQVFLQTNSSTVGLVNAAVIVLVIAFLTLPTVFVLAEYLRNRRRREGTAVAIATAGAPTPDPAPVVAETVTQPKPEPVVHGIRVLSSSTSTHDFTREPVSPRPVSLRGIDASMVPSRSKDTYRSVPGPASSDPCVSPEAWPSAKDARSSATSTSAATSTCVEGACKTNDSGTATVAFEETVVAPFCPSTRCV